MPLINPAEMNPFDWRGEYPARQRKPEKPKEEYNPVLDPHFSAEKMESNEIVFDHGHQAIARIPVLEGRIRTDGENVLFLADEYYDEEKEETVRKEVVIGSELEYIDRERFRGLMSITFDYHEYFDLSGNLIPNCDPLQQRKAMEAKKKAEKAEAEKQRKAMEAKQKTEKAEAEQENESDWQTETGESGNSVSRDPDSEIRAALQEQEKQLRQQQEALQKKEKEQQEALKKKEEDLDQLLKETGERALQLEKYRLELDGIMEAKLKTRDERAEAQIRLLDSILGGHEAAVREQAKRRPDHLMHATQIRVINEILIKLQEIFTDCEGSDYLHLAEEPRENDLEHFPGTTYGEMAILLSAYVSIIDAFFSRRLYYKDSGQENDTQFEEDEAEGGEDSNSDE